MVQHHGLCAAHPEGFGLPFVVHLLPCLVLLRYRWWGRDVRAIADGAIFDGERAIADGASVDGERAIADRAIFDGELLLLGELKLLQLLQPPRAQSAHPHLVFELPLLMGTLADRLFHGGLVAMHVLHGPFQIRHRRLDHTSVLHILVCVLQIRSVQASDRPPKMLHGVEVKTAGRTDRRSCHCHFLLVEWLLGVAASGSGKREEASGRQRGLTVGDLSHGDDDDDDDGGNDDGGDVGMMLIMVVMVMMVMIVMVVVIVMMVMIVIWW